MPLESMDFAALGLFGAAVAVLTAALVLLSGFLPLSSLSPDQRSAGRLGLLALAALATLLLAVLALRFALERLAAAPAVVAGGLALLAGPLLFQLLPRGWRNGAAGLCAALLATTALAALITLQP